MIDAETGQIRPNVIPTVDYNRCGTANPVRARFDLDSNAEYAELANIRLGSCPEPLARLFVKGRDDAPFRFAMASGMTTQATLRVQESVRLVLQTELLFESANKGKNPVLVAGRLIRQLDDGRSSEFDLRVEIELFRSGPPRARFEMESIAAIDAAADPPVDRNVPLGSLAMIPEFSKIPFTGRARVVIDAKILLPEWAPLKPSLRAHRLRRDADDRVWKQADLVFNEELVLDPVEARFVLHRIDFGIPHVQLRDWLASTRSQRATARKLTLEVRAWVESFDSPQEPLAPMLDRLATIEVIGVPQASVAFAGLGPPLPMVLSLGDSGSQAEYQLAPLQVSAQAIAKGEFTISPLRLEIEYDGWNPAHVEIACNIREITVLTPVLAGDATLDPSSGQPIVNFEIDVASILADLGPGAIKPGTLSCLVSVTIRRKANSDDPVTDVFNFDIPIIQEAAPISWMACVDFGTSSTAIWMGRNTGDAAGLSLRLGDWLSRFDPLHDESPLWQDSGMLSDDLSPELTYSYLLPSHIGLSSEVNLRIDQDPLSLGDLTLSQPGEEAQSRRLQWLSRSYDVSVPFPSTALAQHGDAVVTQPKRRMVGRADHVRLNAEVAERNNGQIRYTHDVNLARLIADCFHELGGYVANSALALDTVLSAERRARAQRGGGTQKRRAIATEVAEAQLNHNSRFGVVLTHPSGISRERQNIYREAGRRFLEGFCGSDRREQDRGAIVLVAEALAAARFGVQHYAENCEIGASGEPRSFITLDVGAGTYDVTVIDTYLTPKGPTDWKVHSHFGLAVGGHELDDALADRVMDILDRAAHRAEISSRFEFEPVLQHGSAGLWRPREMVARRAGIRFWSELQAAKVRLTQRLLKPSLESYSWPQQAEGGPAFDMQVGLLGDANWPVQLKSSAATPSEHAAWPVPGTSAELAIERTKKGLSIRLRMWREAFERGEQDHDTRLADLIELMATELPRLAWIEHQRKAGHSRQHPPTWIVTGRAALWPPLFEALSHSIATFGPEAGELAQRKPFSPEGMKHAVVRGAVQLTSEPWAEADFAVYNPVAVITYKLRAALASGASPGRVIADVIRVHDSNQPSSQKIIETTEPFVIARILPGLDEEKGRESRIELFNRLGIEPWVELERERPRSIGRGGRTRWSVSTRRDASGLSLTFDPGDENGMPVTFGPLREGRIYAAD
jgi:hypothetical protein